MCLISFNGCMVPHAHATQLKHMIVSSEPLKPLHIENGFHDDDGREHEPQQTRRETAYAEDLRRDDPPDQEEVSEI
ncbi:hypothetical protein LVY74_05295 [Acinetobacter sp. ME22]|uniref:hypothetical protein n=1 Tax=Acinetobacter sp. ME22 TaxID=2904802 RepID=UPI001ED9CB5D|nr:hypothetical protein [Acinetobacter sp. ME22]MCG2572974.1 hypothetical protein [Acinetobacter sp. ME22]